MYSAALRHHIFLCREIHCPCLPVSLHSDAIRLVSDGNVWLGRLAAGQIGWLVFWVILAGLLFLMQPNTTVSSSPLPMPSSMVTAPSVEPGQQPLLSTTAAFSGNVAPVARIISDTSPVSDLMLGQLGNVESVMSPAYLQSATHDEKRSGSDSSTHDSPPFTFSPAHTYESLSDLLPGTLPFSPAPVLDVPLQAVTNEDEPGESASEKQLERLPLRASKVDSDTTALATVPGQSQRKRTLPGTSTDASPDTEQMRSNEAALRPADILTIAMGEIQSPVSGIGDQEQAPEAPVVPEPVRVAEPTLSGSSQPKRRKTVITGSERKDEPLGHWACHLCSASFSLESTLNIHLSIHRLYGSGQIPDEFSVSNERLASLPRDNSTQPVKCDDCGKTFLSESDLQYHKFSHDPPESRPARDSRVKPAGMTGRPGAPVLQRRERSRTVSTVTTPSSTVSRAVPARAETQASSTTVFQGDAQQYCCPLCNEDCLTQNRLGEHLQIHAMTGLNPLPEHLKLPIPKYISPQASATRGKTKPATSADSRRATSTPMWKCVICEQMLATRAELAEHKRTRHAGAKLLLLSRSLSDAPERISTPVVTAPLAVCREATSASTTVLSSSSQHTHRISHQCNTCHQLFTNDRELLAHRQICFPVLRNLLGQPSSSQTPERTVVAGASQQQQVAPLSIVVSQASSLQESERRLGTEPLTVSLTSSGQRTSYPLPTVTSTMPALSLVSQSQQVLVTSSAPMQSMPAPAPAPAPIPQSISFHDFDDIPDFGIDLTDPDRLIISLSPDLHISSLSSEDEA